MARRQRRADGLGRGFQFRDMVASVIEPVAHSLEGGRRGGNLRFGQVPGQQVGALGSFAQFRRRRRRALVGQRRAQVGDQPRFIGIREKLHVQPEGAVQLQQHRHRQRALVLLDLVEVAWGNPQCARQRRLGHAAFLAQAAQPDAHVAFRHLRNLRNLQAQPSQINAFSVV